MDSRIKMYDAGPEAPKRTKRDLFVVAIFVFNAFSWYWIIFYILSEFFENMNVSNSEILTIWVIHFAAMAVSAFSGAVVSGRIVDRVTFLRVWMVLGVCSSLLPILLGDLTITNASILSLLLAISFGLGMPSCMAYFADFTSVENRGRLGGITFSIIGIGIFLFTITLGPLETTGQVISSAIWRGLGLALFLLLGPKPIDMKKRKTANTQAQGYASIIRERDFFLYFVPWVMFCLVDGFEGPLLENFFGPGLLSLTIIEFAISGIFALVGGFLSDFVGRKRVVVVGFVALGVGYAALGLAPELLFSWYFYSVVEGIAGGMFGAVFLMTIWGDLARTRPKERYYALGGIPYLLSALVGFVVDPYVHQISTYAAFSLASLFLFVAVLPLIYAAETLPERKIELRQLRKYVKTAREVKEKYED
ncbi:MAG: MFS transporter [Candidatus Bathyarchaeota archaeon]|nr:MAG: MFS transporter [Candidatus Bathyarchaeota archaeon]